MYLVFYPLPRHHPIKPVLFFIALTQCAVVNDRAIQLKAAWYRNWYRHVTILGGIVAPRYRDLFDTYRSIKGIAQRNFIG